MQSPAEHVLQLASGKWITFALSAAAELGVADRLTEGPRTSEELARAVGADPRRLRRLLRALASVGVFRSTPDGRFAQNEASDLLRSDTTGSLRALVRMLGAGYTNRTWERLADAVRGERDVFQSVHGTGLFEYLEKHPEDAAVFDEAMSGHVRETALAFVAAYDVSGFVRVVDVGGGDGTLLAAILQANPRARGVVFDLPRVAEVAAARLRTAGLSARAEAVGGDFFRDVPAGGDVYVLSMVLHDWGDDKARAILATVRRAMPAGGRLLVLGYPVPPGDEPAFAKLLDLEMLVGGGAGEERTETEYRALLAAEGFETTRVVALDSGASVVEARPVAPPA